MSKQVQSKREQFTNKKRSKLPFFLIGIGLTLGVILILSNVFSSTNSTNEEYFGDPVAEGRSYMGEFISMTKIEPEVSNGQISFSLEDVDTNNIVYFEVNNNENVPVPLMAYITPTGRLFAGSSMCEPCRGRTFSLAGEALVCDTCRTTYTIESHQFISGSRLCGSFPPINMNPVVENGMIIIELEQVLSWKPRT